MSKLKNEKVPSIKEIEHGIISGEWKPGGEVERARVLARNKTMRATKDGKINQRINSKDLLRLKKIAAKKGLGYQTLLGSIIHEYVSGKLVDIDEVRKVIPTTKRRA